MEPLLIFRALGVPDHITNEDNRDRAAASRLAVLAGRPLDMTLMRDVERESRLRDLLRYVAEQARSGGFDGVLGNLEAPETTVDRLARSAPVSGYEEAVTLLTPLVTALVAFVATHPFIDQTGRYFA